MLCLTQVFLSVTSDRPKRLAIWIIGSFQASSYSSSLVIVILIGLLMNVQHRLDERPKGAIAGKKRSYNKQLRRGIIGQVWANSCFVRDRLNYRPNFGMRTVCALRKRAFDLERPEPRSHFLSVYSSARSGDEGQRWMRSSLINHALENVHSIVMCQLTWVQCLHDPAFLQYRRSGGNIRNKMQILFRNDYCQSCFGV